MMVGPFAYMAVTHSDNWIVPALVGRTLAPVAVWIATRPSRVRVKTANGVD